MGTIFDLVFLAIITLLSGLAGFVLWYRSVSYRQVPQGTVLAIFMGGQYTDLRGPGWVAVWRGLETAEAISVASRPIEVFEPKETVRFQNALAPIHLKTWVSPLPDFVAINKTHFQIQRGHTWEELAKTRIASAIRGMFATIPLLDAQKMKGDLLSSQWLPGTLIDDLEKDGIVINALSLEGIDEPPDITAAAQALAKTQLDLQAVQVQIEQQVQSIAGLSSQIVTALAHGGQFTTDEAKALAPDLVKFFAALKAGAVDWKQVSFQAPPALIQLAVNLMGQRTLPPIP